MGQAADDAWLQSKRRTTKFHGNGTVPDTISERFIDTSQALTLRLLTAVGKCDTTTTRTEAVYHEWTEGSTRYIVINGIPSHCYQVAFVLFNSHSTNEHLYRWPRSV